MLNKLKPKSEFSRNVVTLMTGTTIAQAIPIAISPILTRIYTPEDFGVFAVYLSILTIVAVVATGKYELAIMLPEEENDALNLVSLSILLVSFLYMSIKLEASWKERLGPEFEKKYFKELSKFVKKEYAIRVDIPQRHLFLEHKY